MQNNLGITEQLAVLTILKNLNIFLKIVIACRNFAYRILLSNEKRIWDQFSSMPNHAGKMWKCEGNYFKIIYQIKQFFISLWIRPRCTLIPAFLNIVYQYNGIWSQKLSERSVFGPWYTIFNFFNWTINMRPKFNYFY